MVAVKDIDRTNIRAATTDDQTALHGTARPSGTELIRYLIEQGADVRTVTADKGKVSHSACWYDSASIRSQILSVTDMRINHRANLDARDKTGATPLYLSFETHHCCCVDFLNYRIELDLILGN